MPHSTATAERREEASASGGWVSSVAARSASRSGAARSSRRYGKVRRYAGEGKVIASRLRRIADEISRGSMADYRATEKMRRDADDMRACGRHGVIVEDALGNWKSRVWSCKHRLCPYCEYERATGRRDLMDAIASDYPADQYEWILQTFTVRNVVADETRTLDDALADAVRRLRTDFKKLRRRWYMHTEPYVNSKGKKCRREVWEYVGYVAAIEITAADDGSLHPHLHVMMVFPKGYRNPLANTYHRVKDRAGVVHDVMSEDPERGYMIGRTTDRARTQIWVSHDDGIRESERDYILRCRRSVLEGKSPASIQGAWSLVGDPGLESRFDAARRREAAEGVAPGVYADRVAIAGYICDSRRAESRQEVAKYMTKPGVGKVASDEQLLALYRGTARIQRWLSGGAFHGLAGLLEEASAKDDDEKGPPALVVGTWKSLLTNPDPAIRARAESAIRVHVWAPYDPDELRAWWRSPHDTGPPSWVTYVLLAPRDDSPAVDDWSVSYQEING